VDYDKTIYVVKQPLDQTKHINLPTHIWRLVLSVVHKIVLGSSSMIRFTLVIAVSEQDMPGIEPGPLYWHTSALTNEIQEVSQ
jgi:hypothetical protein